jgi:integral membrane protein
MKNPVPLLRRLTLIEGVSFLLLLGVAMPLKYFAGMPMAVKIVGWAHGLLFVAFCFVLLHTMIRARWSFARAAAVFVASLLPFGPFVLDRNMRQWENEVPPPAES